MTESLEPKFTPRLCYFLLPLDVLWMWLRCVLWSSFLPWFWWAIWKSIPKWSKILLKNTGFGTSQDARIVRRSGDLRMFLVKREYTAMAKVCFYLHFHIYRHYKYKVVVLNRLRNVRNTRNGASLACLDLGMGWHMYWTDSHFVEEPFFAQV